MAARSAEPAFMPFGPRAFMRFFLLGHVATDEFFILKQESVSICGLVPPSARLEKDARKHGFFQRVE